MISGFEAMQLGIPASAWRGRVSINNDTGMIDRRRLARAIRREYEAIRRDIDELGAQIPPVVRVRRP